MEWLEEQVYWKRNNGWDHVFICQDPNALYKIIDRVKNGVLLLSDFGRLAANQASLVKDVILPYSHRINSYKGDIGLETRKSLLFFMGNRFRKEVTICFSLSLKACIGRVRLLSVAPARMHVFINLKFQLCMRYVVITLK